jgi:hypothetical protein
MRAPSLNHLLSVLLGELSTCPGIGVNTFSLGSSTNPFDFFGNLTSRAKTRVNNAQLLESFKRLFINTHPLRLNQDVSVKMNPQPTEIFLNLLHPDWLATHRINIFHPQ